MSTTTHRRGPFPSPARGRVILRLLAPLAWLAIAAPGAGQPVLLPGFQVLDDQFFSRRHAEGVAIGKDGGFSLAWTRNSGLGFARFSPQATQMGLLLPVSPYPADKSSIARDASRRSVVVWSHNTYVLARRLGANGMPLGDTFQVNAWTTLGVSDASVASDASGNFVVAWSTADGRVVARRFDSEGAPLGDEILVNQWTPTGTRFASKVATSAAGFVVSWVGQGASGTGIFARSFARDGTPLTPDLAVDPAPGSQTTDVAMDASGGFVVVWTGTSSAAVARRYASSGIPEGGVFPVSASLASKPEVASDSTGNFLVVWNDAVGSVAARSFDAAGEPAGAEFQVSASPDADGYLVASYDPHPALADDGSFVVAWTSHLDYGVLQDYHVYGRKSGLRSAPAIPIDPAPGLAPGVATAGNGVFEPGETQVVNTAWLNASDTAVGVSGTAPSFTGPAGASYTIIDGAASYGTIAAAQGQSCAAMADCYAVTVSSPAVRPASHWDARLQENLSIGVPKTWVLHIGESFADVPASNPFYPSVETLLHNGITGGCVGGGYCPAKPVTRAQMAVFLLKSKLGAAHVPPPCTGTVFTDVPCAGSPFDPWIEEVAALGITAGCSDGVYCPGDAVSREQMAVFLLKTLQGSAYVPPACTPQFEDVPCSSPFAAWIGELARRGITGGCSASPALYCPTTLSNRGQMAAFLTRTFGLVLYGG